jgi:tetratricopeptide (TPR) repeat protein
MSTVEARNESTNPRADRRAVVGVSVCLVAGVWLLFWRVAGFDFISFDDPVYVTENPHVLGGLTWESVIWALRSVGYAGNWHPLTWLSHMLDVQLFGLNAGAHHLVNVFLHALNSVFLFLAIRSMISGPQGQRHRSPWIAAFVAGMFAVHPLRIESVVWVAERKDVLSTMFWFLTLLFYARYARKPEVGRYLPVAISLALGLLAKPMLVTVPFTLLLLDVWPLGRLNVASPWGTLRRRTVVLVVEKIPLVALVAASCILTWLAQHAGGAISSVTAVPIATKVANALVSYVDYIGKLFWPAGLAVFYPFRLDGIPVWKAAGSAAVVLLVTVFVVGYSRRRPWLGVGWLWYLITLLPVIGLIQIGLHSGADRYTYVPHVGLYLILACGLFELHERLRLPSSVLGVALLVPVLAYATVTSVQLKHWRDGTTLFTRATEVTSGNFVAHHGLALELAEAGQREEAIEHLRQAVRYGPSYGSARRDLGRLLLAQGRPDAALAQLSEALRLKPDDHRAHIDLAAVHLAMGRDDLAVAACEEALRLNPRSYRAHNQLGVALEWRRETDRAAEAYRRAATIRPDAFEPHLNLGGALARLGRFEEAAASFRAAIEIRPDSVEARLGLGAVSFLGGDRMTAMEQHDRLLDLDPGRADRLREMMREGTESAPR